MNKFQSLSHIYIYIFSITIYKKSHFKSKIGSAAPDDLYFMGEGPLLQTNDHMLPSSGLIMYCSYLKKITYLASKTNIVAKIVPQSYLNKIKKP